MSDTEIMAPPVIDSPLKSPTKFEREQAAFRRLLPQLLNDYRNKYVAIHDEQVVGSGDDLVTVALEAYNRHGYQPIYVDLVTDAPVRPIRIPHYRILSPR